MNSSYVVIWRMSITALVFLFIVINGSAAKGQAVATPEEGCPKLITSPVSTHATPVHDTLATLATPGAAAPECVTHEGSVIDRAGLINALPACALTVESVGSVEQPFLQPESGMVLQLSGGDLVQPAEIQVFEYGDAERATDDAAQIGPAGHPPTMMISWLATPHFYQAGRLIVLYVGDDQAVVDLLTTLLGAPFAGG